MPASDPLRPEAITPETVHTLSEDTVERMLRWFSLRLQAFKPGEDETRRTCIRIFYEGTRTASDPQIVEQWRQLYEEEEAAWASRETCH